MTGARADDEDKHEEPPDGPDRASDAADYPASLSDDDRKLWETFARLNEREQRYLRLSAQGYTSKDIALLENGRDQRVSKVIERARTKCGGILRRDLSRKFADWESWNQQGGEQVHGGISSRAPMPETLDDQSFPVAERNPGLSQQAAVHRRGASREPARDTAPSSEFASPILSLRFPVGIGGSARNELDRLPRLVAILIIAAAGALTAGAALSLLFVLDHLASSH